MSNAHKYVRLANKFERAHKYRRSTPPGDSAEIGVLPGKPLKDEGA
jgi:hypothetical protein